MDKNRLLTISTIIKIIISISLIFVIIGCIYLFFVSSFISIFVDMPRYIYLIVAFISFIIQICMVRSIGDKTSDKKEDNKETNEVKSLLRRYITAFLIIIILTLFGIIFFMLKGRI